jgi:hypothetical protein
VMQKSATELSALRSISAHAPEKIMLFKFSSRKTRFGSKLLQQTMPPSASGGVSTQEKHMRR